MSTSTRITMAQYDEMIRQGRFEPREEYRVELIYGEIVSMSPINPPHNNTVLDLIDWSIEVLPLAVARLSVQGAVGIAVLDSEPQPDVVWLRRKDYSVTHPEPDDVLLVIEVADSSLDKDRGLKARLYAEAGMADYWIVNLPERCVEVRRDPHGTVYHSVETFRLGQDVRPLAFPDAVLPVVRVFPG
jgi:Uma2 family endonuclease